MCVWSWSSAPIIASAKPIARTIVASRPLSLICRIPFFSSFHTDVFAPNAESKTEARENAVRHRALERGIAWLPSEGAQFPVAHALVALAALARARPSRVRHQRPLQTRTEPL